MLKSEHAQVRYDFRSMQVYPDRLHRQRDRSYLPAARDAIDLYRHGVGRTRQDLHRDVEDRLNEIPTCTPRRAAAFCKLLDDISLFSSEGRTAASLRRRVFTAGARWHPIVTRREGIFEHEVDAVRTAVADEVGLSWDEIMRRLFADVIELQTLELFPDEYTAEDLLARYNVAQIQAALYKATRIWVDARSDFKTIVRQAKLSGLMHVIDPLPPAADGSPGYRFRFDGPGSALRTTARYGIGFAKLVGCLLACQRWRMSADILGPKRQRFRLSLSPADGLRSTFEPPDEFDSQLERDVQEVWDREPVPGWQLTRESELLHRGQTVMTPDFVLHNDQGAKIYLEAVGYWTPEYLQEKADRLRRFAEVSEDSRWLLIFGSDALADRLGLEDLPVAHLKFSAKQSPRQWLTAAGL